MIINLSEILCRENCTMEEQVIAEFDSFESRMGKFLVKEKAPFVLSITHEKNGICHLKGNTEITITASCNRCLEDVDVRLELELDKELSLNSKVDDENELYETNYIDGYNLDVDKLLYNEILIGWPMKILCSEDCEGICNACGQNLNKGTCDCEDTSLDPRMSVIRDVFKNFKEV